MQANLTLSRTSAQATSTWEGKYIVGGSFSYTTPTTDYDNITITLPQDLTGAIFSAVHFSYTGASASGTKTIKFSDTREAVTDAALLKRLQDGATSITLLFSFKATGGSGGSGTHSSTCYWQNLSATVDYTPAAAVSGTTYVGFDLYYAFKQANIAEGEPFNMILSMEPAANVSQISLVIRASGAAAATAVTYDWDINAPAGVQTTTEVSATLSGLTYPSRVKYAVARFKSIRNGQSYTGSWFNISELLLIRERLAPSISATWTDTGTGTARAGAYVQGKSTLSAAISITLDTEADPSISTTARTLTVGGRTYAAEGDTVTIPTDELTGNIAWSMSATDSHGKTGTAAGSLTVLPYTAPTVSALTLARYTQKTDSKGETIYPDTDDGVKIRIYTAGTYTRLNGANAWMVTAKYAGAEKGSATGTSDDGSFEIKDDDGRSLISGSYAATQAHTFTIVVSDIFEAREYSIVIPKAGGILSLEKGGVGIGMRCTATEDAPKLQVAYPAYFTGGIYGSDNRPVGKLNYSLDETEIGTWIDGKTLYRKGVNATSISTSTDTPSAIDFSVTPAQVISITGFIRHNTLGILPLNTYHSDSIRSFARWDTGTHKAIIYTKGSNAGGVIFIEYTKET